MPYAPVMDPALANLEGVLSMAEPAGTGGASSHTGYSADPLLPKLCSLHPTKHFNLLINLLTNLVVRK